MWGLLFALMLSLVSFYYCKTYNFYDYSPSCLFETGLARFFFVRQITGVILSLIVIRVVIQCSGSYNTISRFGSFSMALYMFHTQMIAIFPITFEGSDNMRAWLQRLLIVVVWTSVSYGLILASNSCQPFRKLFLGK